MVCGSGPGFSYLCIGCQVFAARVVAFQRVGGECGSRVILASSIKLLIASLTSQNAKVWLGQITVAKIGVPVFVGMEGRNNTGYKHGSS